jgi:hypothetical protein
MAQETHGSPFLLKGFIMTIKKADDIWDLWQDIGGEG